MKTLLQIKSSIFSEGGQSSRLTERFIAAWRESNPDGQVIVRDLALEPIPHLDAGRFGAFLAKPGERSAAQQAVIEHSDALIDELRRADVIPRATPRRPMFATSSLFSEWTISSSSMPRVSRSAKRASSRASLARMPRSTSFSDHHLGGKASTKAPKPSAISSAMRKTPTSSGVTDGS